MPQIETAKGPVDCAVLGTTLMHEHVFILSPEISVTQDQITTMLVDNPRKIFERQGAYP